MKGWIALIAGGAVLWSVAVYSMGQHPEGGKMIQVKADELEWQSGPPSLPEGAQYVVMEGDPSEEGIFTMRLKAPAGYRIPPHTHPRVERVTVLSGTFKLGMGREFDEEAMETLPAGSFFTMPPGMEHYAATEEETVVQLTGEGPWGINYVNPDDDPRNQGEMGGG